MRSTVRRDRSWIGDLRGETGESDTRRAPGNASGIKLRIARILRVMAVVDRSTSLDAPADAVWAAVKTPAAFRSVTRRLLVMPAIRRRQDEWREGETVVGWVFLFGFLPFSRHHLHIVSIDESTRTLSSREFGGLITMWNHDIEVVPIDAAACDYRDRIEVNAGILTPVIVLYARWFYRMRQRRWRALAKGLSRWGG